MAAPVINKPAHLEHRIEDARWPDSGRCRIAVPLQVAEEAGPAINVVVGASDIAYELLPSG